jgi:hypothetical protein
MSRRDAIRGARALGAILAVAGSAGAAAAHTQVGVLEEPASVVDIYQVTCFDDGAGAPASLVTRVRDGDPVLAPLVSLQAQKGFQATNATDAVDGDPESSPSVWVNGGPGSYDVFVDKSGSGSELYTLSFHCMTGPGGGGEETGATIVPIATGPSEVPGLGPVGALALAAGLFAIAARALRAGARLPAPGAPS